MARTKKTSTSSSKSSSKKTASSTSSARKSVKTSAVKAASNKARAGSKTTTKKTPSKNTAKAKTPARSSSSVKSKTTTSRSTASKVVASKSGAPKKQTKSKVSAKAPARKVPAKTSTKSAVKGNKKVTASQRGLVGKSAQQKSKPTKAAVKNVAVKISANGKNAGSKNSVAKASAVKAMTAQKSASKSIVKSALEKKIEKNIPDARSERNVVKQKTSSIIDVKSVSKAGKKASSVVKDAPAVQEKETLQDSLKMTKNSTSSNGAALNGKDASSEVAAAAITSSLASQVSVDEVPEVPVKRKRGRPRKSESVNGSAGAHKLKETKGVRRFGMNYGRPGVAAGRYSWSAETGTSNEGSVSPESSEDQVDPISLAGAIEVDFNQGDKVVYPAHGLGIVEAIQVRSVGGSQQKFYMITIVETGMKIMVPVGQSKTVGLRRVVDPTTVDQVYDILRDKDIVIDNQTWNRRYREYSQKIKTGSVLEIASVIRDLTVLKIEKELSFNERRMLDTAQGLLVKELSIAKASSEDSIKEELELICQP